MMLGKLKQDYTPFPVADTRVRLTGDLDQAVAAPSPARALQMELEARTYPEPDIQKWSPRRRLAFLIASASTLWLAIISAGVGTMHAIA